MKRNFIVLGISLLFAFSAMAQEFKAKKGMLLMDNSPIAKVTDKRGVYTFSDLEGNEIVKIKMEILNTNVSSRIIYYNVSLPDESKSVNILNKSEKKSLSGEKKLFSDFSQGEFKLISAEGINKAALDQIFQSDQQSLADIIGVHQKAYEENKKELSYYDKTGLNFTMNGDVGKGSGQQFNKLGHLYRKEVKYGHNTYELLDANGKSIAFWNKDGDFMLKLASGKSYLVNLSFSSPSSGMNMDNTAKIIAAYAYEADLLK